MSIKDIAEMGALLIAAAGFLFGVIQYFRQEQLKREDRRIEAARPFLELQLQLYQDATGAAAAICTTSDENTRKKAVTRLEELYWGHLSMVEDEAVEHAMVRLKSGIDEGKGIDDLQILSLKLAHACRKSLSNSWNTAAWTKRHGRGDDGF